MPPRALRCVVVAVFVLGVAGIIASLSIADDPDAALASGLLTVRDAVDLGRSRP